MTEVEKPAWLKMTPVDVHYVQEMNQHIAAKARREEFEAAAFIERELFVDVLKSIAIGVKDPKGLALEAMKNLEIHFPRRGFK